MKIDNGFSPYINTHSNLKQEQGLDFENRAKNESQAISKVLGYGVDSEGYFTSDFNKVAGIPQDYKIHSDITKYFDKISNYHLAPYSSFDLAKTLGNAYQAFEQVFSGINDKQSISEEKFLSLPVAFDYSFNNGNFELHKVYSLDEYQSDVWQRASGKKQLQSGVSQTSLFFVNDPVSSKDFSKLDFASAFKTNKDGTTINKGELLVQFFTEANLGIVGETSIAGKIMGASGNKVAEELHNFMKQNPLFDIDMGDLILDIPQTRALFNSNLSVEEFKEKWLELKEQMAQGKEVMSVNSTSTQDNATLTNPQSEEKKTFTPIQAESSRETYKDLSGAKNLELAKMEQMADMLAILFNQKAGDNSALKGLFTTQTRKVDIKA